MPEDKQKILLQEKEMWNMLWLRGCFFLRTVDSIHIGMHTDIFQLSSTRFQVFQILGKLKAMTKEREWDNEVNRSKDPQACNTFTSNKADVLNYIITSCLLLTLDTRKSMCAKDLLSLMPQWTVVFSAKSRYPWKIEVCLKEPVCSCMMTVHLNSTLQ